MSSEPIEGNCPHGRHLRAACRLCAESRDRTGDVLTDAADDIQGDWPWCADASRTAVAALDLIAGTHGSECAHPGAEAAEALRRMRAQTSGEKP